MDESNINGIPVPDTERENYHKERLDITVESEVEAVDGNLNHIEIRWYASSSRHEGVVIEDTPAEALRSLVESISTDNDSPTQPSSENENETTHDDGTGVPEDAPRFDSSSSS